MSTVIRSKLSPEDLEMIDQTALESWEYQKKLWAQAEKTAREELKLHHAVNLSAERGRDGGISTGL